MKHDIHPTYGPTKVTCSCGNAFETQSTQPDINVELCSACHPFFTGQHKIIDTAGKVERFNKRMGVKKDVLVSKRAKRVQRTKEKKEKAEK